jgi:ATP/maltotriose-dependent transcriptional regulator MalT
MAYRYFSHGFCHLWSDQLDEAEAYLQIARQMTEQNGDLSLLAWALAYLTVVYRKRGNKESVRDFADYSLRIAEEANMPQYVGMARTQYAWLAWCAGDLAEVKRQVRDAIAVWGGLSAINIPFYWFALFPLMGVALQEEDFEQAVHCAQHMLTPFQQRLPDDLADMMDRAIASWKDGQPDVANDLLHQAVQLAQELHYV